jgi:hypothetical protein
MKKALKKSLVLLMVFTFVTSLPLTSMAASNSNQIENNLLFESNGYTVEFLKDTPDLQEIKFINNNTGEESYLKVTNNGNNTIYTSISSDGEMFEIENIDERIKITDLQTNKEEYLETEKLSVDYLIQPFSQQHGGDPGNTTNWATSGTVLKYSSSKWATDVGALAGILAALVGLGKATSILVTVATWYIANNTKEVWYTYQYYYDVDNPYRQRKITKFYGDPKYKNYLGSESHIYYVPKY